jgi:hypothetical protein
MRIQIGGWTLKIKVSRKGFAVALDTPKDKAIRAEIRRMNQAFKLRSIMDYNRKVA